MNDIEDEFHFVLTCKLYRDIRKKYISDYYCNHASVYKFIELLNSTNKNVLIKLALYILKAFRIRQSFFRETN